MYVASSRALSVVPLSEKWMVFRMTFILSVVIQWFKTSKQFYIIVQKNPLPAVRGVCFPATK